MLLLGDHDLQELGSCTCLYQVSRELHGNTGMVSSSEERFKNLKNKTLKVKPNLSGGSSVMEIPEIHDRCTEKLYISSAPRLRVAKVAININIIHQRLQSHSNIK